MPNTLTPSELAALARLDAKLAALDKQAEPIKAERNKLLLLDRQRRFRARQKAED